MKLLDWFIRLHEDLIMWAGDLLRHCSCPNGYSHWNTLSFKHYRYPPEPRSFMRSAE